MQNIHENSELLWKINKRCATQANYFRILRGQEKSVEEVSTRIGLCTLGAKSRIPLVKCNLFVGYKAAETLYTNQIGVNCTLHETHQVVDFINYNDSIVKEICRFLASNRLELLGRYTIVVNEANTAIGILLLVPDKDR